MTLLDDPKGWLETLRRERPESLDFVRVLGHGKSAVVFEARTDTGLQVAIKLYDQQRLTKFGLDVQLERIQRELELRGHTCGSLVQVHRGGTMFVGGHQFPFIVQELVDGVDLRARLTSGRLSDSEIRSHLRSLFNAADFLDKRDLCHRDIKVDNCRLRSSGDLVLLDLGVLRPINAADLTDDADDPKTKYFLGTLRYAPPEYLRRQESNARAAWRAITIYQIGGVLYEMIHGVPLFSHIREPYAELVQTVLNTVPIVMRQDVGQDLIALTRNCLVKDPEERSKLVPWDLLQDVADARPTQAPMTVDLASRMREAAELYSQTVEAKQAEQKHRDAQRAEAKSIALSCVKQALNSATLAGLNGRIIESRGRVPAITLAIPSNTKLRFPYPLWLCCSVRMEDTAFESVHVECIGLYGDLDAVRDLNKHANYGQQPDDVECKRLSVLVASPQVRAIADSLLHGPPDEASLIPAVTRWGEQIVSKYFDVTEAAWKGHIKEEQARIGRAFFVTERQVRLMLLSLQSHAQF